MKRFLFISIGVVIVLLAALLVTGLFISKDVTIKRKITIHANKSTVFEQMVKFKNWKNWSPWLQMDSSAKLAYFGIDGEIGSGYNWVGTLKKTGEGSMKSVKINGATMEYDINFTKPQKSVAQGILQAEDSSGYTNAIWSLNMHMHYPFNIFRLFMNMDKMIGKDFELGLINLKKYCETHPTAHNIKEVIFVSKNYVGIRAIVKIDDIKNFFNIGLRQLYNPDEKNRVATGIFYSWDMKANMTDIVVAYSVDDTINAPKTGHYIRLDSSKAIMQELKGGYGGLMRVHENLEKYASDNKLVKTLDIEEYIIGPQQEADSNKWLTNVYYLVK